MPAIVARSVIASRNSDPPVNLTNTALARSTLMLPCTATHQPWANWSHSCASIVKQH